MAYIHSPSLNDLCEVIPVEEGNLIINRHYMAFQTQEGVFQPADLDKYEQYKPINELMRLITYTGDTSTEINESARNVLYQAFYGEHPILSFHLVGYGDANESKRKIMDILNPTTESDFVKVLCLNDISTHETVDVTALPFSSREELRKYLSKFMSAENALELSEAVRKGLLYEGPSRERHKWIQHEVLLNKLPDEITDILSKIKYLPSKELNEIIVRYAIIAARQTP